jgi:hypothetical protein
MNTKRKANNATARRSLIPACHGEAGKTFYLAFWLPALSALWAACFVLAMRFYPGYQIPDRDISDLGDPAMNPKGWSFWAIGMGIAAMMTFPPISYASRRMEALTARQAHGGRRLVSLGSICMRCSCFGLAGLALAPQSHNIDAIHVISGVCALGGVYVTLLFFWGAPLFKIQEMSVARLALFTLSAWWGVAGFLATQGYRFFAYGELGHDVKHRGESVFLHFSLWEWMLFASATTSFAMLVALLPSKVETNE